MRLFKYEMKKLLVNRNRLLLLAVMFVFYTLLSFALGAGSEYELYGEAKEIAVSEYKGLVVENAGKLNDEQLSQSKAIVEEAVAKYGKGEPLNYHLNRDPVLKFHFRYNAFGQKVSEYWNGPRSQRF